MVQIAEVVFRTFLATILLIIIIRLFGKFAITNVTYLGFMVHIMIGSIAANMAFNLRIRIIYFVLSFVVFACIIAILNKVTQKMQKVSKWILGEPAIIIKDGKILEENIRKAGFTLNSLTQELRFKDAFNVDEVEYAIIEPNGHLSLLKKPEYRTVTRKDLSINVTSSKEKFPVELIVAGEIIENNLALNNLDSKWLLEELSKRKLNLKDINYAIISTSGNIYFDMFKDNIKLPDNSS